ncbi:hypothetical protein PGT21_020747 [Puccinia graminis f. sp. tritici]|uniref:Uncharacterized protein n=1 Tax=Puccinia graminis f. sp. tritici TaxID=56615 RepID=A0A5B0QP61_PUCGR|nr:hypothetical protein PGT21_020747 [Puccinia graminis f. sp. tritici]
MVRQAAKTLDVNLNPSVQEFEGFAYVSNCKPQHSHSKKPNNEDLDPRSMAKLFLEYSFAVFECNSKP